MSSSNRSVPDDWMMLRGNYQGWGYSTLDQINRANVKGLQLVWARAMEPGINEATPVVHNGVMFLGNPNDVIQAMNLQKSQYGPSYYVNVGWSLRSQGDVKFPKDHSGTSASGWSL